MREALPEPGPARPPLLPVPDVLARIAAVSPVAGSASLLARQLDSPSQSRRQRL